MSFGFRVWSFAFMAKAAVMILESEPGIIAGDAAEGRTGLAALGWLDGFVGWDAGGVRLADKKLKFHETFGFEHG
jgi:hypothetical protein